MATRVKQFSATDFVKARKRLNLSRGQAASMLGYTGPNLAVIGARLDNGDLRIREPQRRLIEAYLSGYRPPDWPT